jgi:hypothetical protein
MSATINQSNSDAINQIPWLIPELTLVHKTYKLASFQEPVTAYAAMHLVLWTNPLEF